MDMLNRVEYRLDFVENSPYEKHIQSKYFESLNNVYEFIQTNRVYNFKIVKEELIASRHDSEGAYATSKD